MLYKMKQIYSFKIMFLSKINKKHYCTQLSSLAHLVV